MGLFDFLFNRNKTVQKTPKEKTVSSNKPYSSQNKVKLEKEYVERHKSATSWHDAVGIYVSDEFEATVYERRGYGIMVSFMHNGKEYKGLVHNNNMSSGYIKDSTDLFSDGEKVWIVVLGFDENERIILKLKYYKKGDVLPTEPEIEIGTQCNCIVKEVKDKCVIVDLEDYKGITGYISIHEMSYAFVECPSYMFKKGDHISAITIKQSEREKVQLSFKDMQDTNTYQVGMSIAVRLVEKDSSTEKLIVVTEDKNRMLAYVPFKEISWTKNTDLQGQQYFNVKIISIDTHNRYKLTCSIRELKENPWEKAIYSKGMEISAIIVSYSEKGINIITDDKYNLPGIIKKNQITWLKNDNEVTEEDYPKLHSKIVVSIIKFVPERMFLSCSLRELQDNPWLHIKIGNKVQGKAYSKSDSYIIRLNNRIECECHDKTILEPYKGYEFVVTDIDVPQKRVEVSHTLLQRADLYANQTLDFFKRRNASLHIVKWEDYDKQTTYVLFPQNILFKGEAIALPYLELCIQILENNPPLHFKELKSSDKNPNIVFVSVDMVDNGLTMPTIEFNKIQKRELAAKIVCETKKYIIVNAIGVLGYIEKPEDINTKEKEIMVMFANEQDHPMQFNKFNLIREKSAEGRVVEDFLTEEEKKVIDEKDMALIKSLQEDVPNITKQNCHVFNEEVCLVYDMPLESQINHFFEIEGDLSQQNFWLSMRTEKETGKQTVAIFNRNDSILLCNASNDSFFIKGVYCSKEKTQAQRILNRFSSGNNLVLPGAKLRICKYLSTNNFDFEHLNNILSRQYTIVAKILPELSSKIKDRKEEIGQEYLILSNFLQFQKHKEEKRLQDLELSFSPNSTHIGSFEGYACIVLKDADCLNFFAENEDKQAVKLAPYGTEKAIPGILTKDDESYSVYFKSEQELSTFCHEGFTLTPAANIYHLTIQDASVKEFDLYG